MTDEIEADLRTLLTQRAAEVVADATAGEHAIAARLEAGDSGLAQVVAIGSPRRGPLLVAAALLLVVALGAAALSRGDDSVDTGPAGPGTTIAPSPGDAAVLEFRPVLRTVAVFADGTSTPCNNVEATGEVLPHHTDSGTCFEVGEALPGNALVESVGLGFSSTGSAIGADGSTSTTGATTYYVSITLTEAGIDQFNGLAAECFALAPPCPTGQLAVVVDDVVVSAPTIQQPSFEADAIQISGDFTEDEATALAASLDPSSPGTPTTTTRPSDDPTAGTPGDSARDVVERFARDILDEDWVAMEAEDRDDATFVTLETEGGAAIVARLVFDMGIDAYRLTDLASPGLTARETDGETFVDLPVAGSVAISGFDERLVMEVPYVTAGAVVPAGTAGPYDIPDDATAWLSILVQAEDGAALRLLSRR